AEEIPARFPGGVASFERSRLYLDRDNGDNLEGERIHDHDLIIEDEEPETAELRHDEHDLLRNDEQVEAARHEYADADHEIDVRHPKPRDEPASEDDVVDSRPLLTGERDTASRAGLRERVPLTLAFRHLGLGTGAARHLGLGTLA